MGGEPWRLSVVARFPWCYKVARKRNPPTYHRHEEVRVYARSTYLRSTRFAPRPARLQMRAAMLRSMPSRAAQTLTSSQRHDVHRRTEKAYTSTPPRLASLPALKDFFRRWLTPSTRNG